MNRIVQGLRRSLGGVVVLSLAVCVIVGLAAPAGSSAKPVENPETEHFGIAPGSFHIIPSTSQAGAYADLTTEFDFAHNKQGEVEDDVRNVIVELPPGFLGNATAVPTCTDAELSEEQAETTGGSLPNCSPASAVGRISFELNGSHSETISTSVFNMEVTSPGVTAEFGFRALYTTQVLPITVNPSDDSLIVKTPNIEKLFEPHHITFTVWGLPASPEHDLERERVCTGGECVQGAGGGPVPAHIPVKPFVSNPTSCGLATARLRADSWEHPDDWSNAETQIGPITHCELVPFDPEIQADPTTDSAESPSGLDVSLLVPQNWDNPYALSASHLKDAKVTLPVGYTVNPSAGSGLAGCAPEQYARETYSSLPGEGCPPESTLGSVVIETPLLAEKIEGNVYLATPYDNVAAFGDAEHSNGSLLAMYVVAKDPARGIIVKTAGKVQADRVTGQLTGTFENTPQAPFSKLTVKFRQGATSPLVSPPVCGTYTVLSELTPWSEPLQARSVANSFEIKRGIGGGPCPAAGVPPFKPAVASGTQDNNAGNYSPFYLRITREDGEQEITKFTTVLPSGLTGNLSGIPFCPDSAIEAARHTTGQQQISQPSCPAASEIGHTLVGAGVGSVLAQTPGKVYLAGPYHGAPLSIVSVTSATVGPFDLGTVVIRFALQINPNTAQVEANSTGSDQIPHIIKGIVAHVHDIRVYIDRHGFILNPTSCDPMSILDSVTGAGADIASAADDVPVNVATRFQAADCANLAFKPAFTAFTTGTTSRARGASLTVKLSYPKAPQGTEANIRSVKVELPRQLPSRLKTLQKACVGSTFNQNPAACPAASRVGIARAITPILPEPLQGPAYFVSHGGAKFPELIIVLQGYGVTIDLRGETFISKKGITSSTFRAVPDEPVTSFELRLPQSPDSALAANGNLCAHALHMPTAFTAQNGLVIHQSTRIAVRGCRKRSRHKSKNHKKAKKR